MPGNCCKWLKNGWTGLTGGQSKTFIPFRKWNKKKSRIRETKHLSTDADSSTNTTVGWIKNTQKPDFFLNGKNHLKRNNSKTYRNMPKLATGPMTRGL